MRKSDMITKRYGSNNFYVRFQVPKHLRKQVAKTEIWESLRTPDRKEAEARASLVLAKIQRRISGVVDTGLIKPTPSMLQNFARKFYDLRVKTNLDERRYNSNIERERFLTNPDYWPDYLREVRRAFARSDYSLVGTDDFAFECGIDLPIGSVLYQDFEQMLMRAEIEAAQRYVEFDQGIFSGTPSDPDLVATYEERQPKTEIMPTATAIEGETFMELYEKYAVHKSARITADTIEQRRKVVLRFSEYVGLNKKPSDIRKAEARTWRDCLYEWPLHANQKLAFKGKSFTEVIKANKSVGHPTISLPTIISYVGDVSTFFDWLENEGFTPTNIVAGLAPPKEVGKQKVFNSSIEA